MQSAVRSYVTAGAVPVVAAGLVAMTSISPVAPRALETRVADVAPRLTASVANILPNLIYDIVNIPANELIALGQGTVPLGDNNNQFSFTPSYNGVNLYQTGVSGFTADFTYAGNWWVIHPTNVLGTDPGDIPRYQSIVNVLLPIPSLSVPLGNAITAILASQLPMNVGCTETNAGGCNDPFAILGDMFHLERIFQMFTPQGYTFPVTRNPVTCDDQGHCNWADPNGPEVPWSGQTVKISLNPFAPVTPDVINPAASFLNSLMQEPTGLTPIPNPVTTFANLGKALFDTFNPFVPLTQCTFCQPFVPGSGVTFLDAFQKTIRDFLSLIPGSTPPPTNNYPPNTTTTNLKAVGTEPNPFAALKARATQTAADSKDTVVQSTTVTDLPAKKSATTAAKPESAKPWKKLVAALQPDKPAATSATAAGSQDATDSTADVAPKRKTAKSADTQAKSSTKDTKGSDTGSKAAASKGGKHRKAA